MSARFKKNELNYWPTEKRILATIYGTEKLYPYSVAEEFILRTDYTTVAFTKRKLVSSPKLQRYAWWQHRLSTKKNKSESIKIWSSIATADKSRIASRRTNWQTTRRVAYKEAKERRFGMMKLLKLERHIMTNL